MQKYGKTLKHDRIFPIFYNFAVKINKAMKYFEVFFTISAPKEMIGDVRDVLAAMTAEAGFDTFEDCAEGMKGYVQRSAFDEDALRNAVGALPFPDVSVSYKVCEADDRDWN
jgi:ribosomal protein L11 methyltransferase